MDKLFHEYNIKNEIKTISTILNYVKPSDIQKEILEKINTNNSIKNIKNIKDNYIIKSIAGSGKTFCYFLLILNNFDFNLKKLQNIILLPTRELALQTANYLEKINQSNLKINYSILVGGNDNDKNIINKFNFNNNDDNNTQIIIGTLGKLQSTLNKIKNKNNFTNIFSDLKSIVIDEADKIIQQNKNKIFSKFMELFYNNKKGGKLKIVKIPPALILVSASFDENDSRFFKNYINFESVNYINKNFNEGVAIDKIINSKNNNENKEDNNNIIENKFINNHIKEYFQIFKPLVKQTYFEQKFEKLFQILNNLNQNFKQCLIFYNQKGRGEELAQDIREAGYPTTFIHGDLTQDQRILIYDKIRNVEVKIILATDLFSRGIDLSAVDLVINFDCPFNSTEYFHRVGRTGRYNSFGVAVSFFQENENKILDEIKIKDENNRLILLEEDFIEIFRYDLKMVQSMNVISPELLLKVLEMEKLNSQNILIVKENFEYNNIKDNSVDNIDTNFINKKRRREQYANESLVSDWVEVEEELYDSAKFKYFDDSVNIAEKISNNIQNHITTHDNNNSNFHDNVNKFCLYCNLYKIFENAYYE